MGDSGAVPNNILCKAEGPQVCGASIHA